MKFDISGQGLTSLKNVNFPENVTELVCSVNDLTSLEYCPSSVTKLWCNYNQLTSLEHCPSSLTVLCCSGNQLSSLKYCPSSLTVLYCSVNQLPSLKYCPSSVTELWCSHNQLPSLKHCPSSVTELWCSHNQLTSLKHCPSSVIELNCIGNQLNDEYKDISIGKIHKLHRKKSFLKGLGIVQRIIKDFKARKIQKIWQRWWYDELDDEGVSRYCKRTLADFKVLKLLQNDF